MTRNISIEASSVEPGGFPAISRWLSEATPPEPNDSRVRIPEGCQRVGDGGAMAMFREDLRSLRDRGVCVRGVRGCRYAQPPANGWHPFGMTGAAQAGSLATIYRCASPEPEGFRAISRWLRSNATTPPVSGRRTPRIPEGCQRITPLAARVDGHLKKMGAVWK